MSPTLASRRCWLVGWSYERRVFNNLRYKHGGWLVVRASRSQQFTLQIRKPLLGGYTSVAYSTIYEHVLWTSSRLDGQQRRQTKEEKGKG